ncbi:hypothetical protein EDD86DRAFT_278519 [Gorgonomyces haynaldii]|nr:hypothetical protein EDD86DRAFT_278519 [Gorgonomyces haynaldii]
MATLHQVLDDQVDEIQEIEIKRQLENCCVECEDQPREIACLDCRDAFCRVCFVHQHRKGTRKLHKIQELVKYEQKTVEKQVETVVAEDLPFEFVEQKKTVLERTKFIPLRLTFEERKFLRLLEAALNVSEYTDKIDVLMYSSKSKRIVSQIKELCSILSGLVLAADYQAGQKLFQDRDFESNQEFYSTVFELGRRHKIMNPEKMRSTYGKLVYMLQDSQMPEVKQLLGFNVVKPIKTVYQILSEGNAVEILNDDLIEMATMEILSEGKPRHQIQAEIKRKERAIEVLSRKYQTPTVSDELLKQCLYSIGDNNAFLRTNRDPCEKMIQYLKANFDPKNPQLGNLSIQAGREGARLSHGHEKQYHYVLQSLTLWREVLNEMFMLWTLAEDDLLEESNPYRLRDTGQGLNRVQHPPRVSRIMHTILQRAQQSIGYWVGSSVIHLGDHNVPNALMFIDKYTQIYRILLPITTTLQKLDTIEDENVLEYIQKTFGSIEQAKKDIMTDFFRHAFDGSGADNFFDAGSCIDGRLTSAWNWCSKLEKKQYFYLFLITGFMGFDGQF